MIIVFESEALRELYVSGFTKKKEYRRLPSDIIRRYIKTVNYLRAANRVEDLFQIRSLHYEKKEGDLKEIEAVWINDKYRLLFKSSPDETGIIVNALIKQISKHYEK